MSAQIIPFPHVDPKRLAETLWLLKTIETPKAESGRQWIIDKLRRNGIVVPPYMRETPCNH